MDLAAFTLHNKMCVFSMFSIGGQGKSKYHTAVKIKNFGVN